MLADNDPRLSPLWTGHRAPFHAFHDALAALGAAYDLRDGRSDDAMSRVSVTVSDWHGQDIVTGRRIPLAAFEDLLFAVQQLRALRIAENDRSGWTGQSQADRRIAVRDHWQAKGTDMDAFRARLREEYAESARRHPQPEAVEGWPAKPGETPNKVAKPVQRPAGSPAAPSSPRK